MSIYGIVSSAKKIMTRKNEPMLFVKIEDMSESLEVIVFPSILRETESFWQTDKILAIEGRVSHKDNESKVICSQVREVTPELIARLSATTTSPGATDHAATSDSDREYVSDEQMVY